MHIIEQCLHQTHLTITNDNDNNNDNNSNDNNNNNDFKDLWKYATLLSRFFNIKSCITDLIPFLIKIIQPNLPYTNDLSSLQGYEKQRFLSLIGVMIECGLYYQLVNEYQSTYQLLPPIHLLNKYSIDTDDDNNINEIIFNDLMKKNITHEIQLEIMRRNELNRNINKNTNNNYNRNQITNVKYNNNNNSYNHNNNENIDLNHIAKKEENKDGNDTIINNDENAKTTKQTLISNTLSENIKPESTSLSSFNTSSINNNNDNDSLSQTIIPLSPSCNTNNDDKKK